MSERTEPRAMLADRNGVASAGTRSGSMLAVLVAAAAVAIGWWLRARDIGGLFLYGDELHSLALSRTSYANLIASYEPFGSGVALPLAQRISFGLFGPALWAFRLPTLIAGLATLPLLFVVARSLVGTPAAALATLALALNPLHVYHSHFARAYSAAVLLGLVLLLSIVRVLDAQAPRRPWMAIAAASSGLLLYVHLSAASFAASIGVAALALLALRRRGRAAWTAIGVCFGAGLLLTLVLYLPAWESVRDFLLNKAANRPEALGFSAWDVAVVSAGGPATALLWSLGLLVSLLWMLRVRPDTGLLLAVTALLPIAILACVRPVGGVYAYARYLLVALPLFCVVPAWGLVEGTRRALGGSRHADVVALLAGIALIALAFATGPLGRGEAAGPFANMPESLHTSSLDAHAPPSALYRQLAADDSVRRIVEAPLFSSWRLGLYRRAYFQHRKQVWLGAIGPSKLYRLEGATLDVRDPDELRAAGVDVLIVHRDVDRERTGEAGGARAIDADALRALRERYQAPFYEDEHLLAWRIAPAG